jgi:SpoVK/Ycf46/Vps4 family AAA+-type ATPase
MALERALHDAVRQHRGARMGGLATRVERLATWGQVCLPPEVLDSVRELVSRVRHRMTVFERWGFGRVLSNALGLTALFEGRPGTGKTMVAGLIARELGCDLYRIDLSRVLSKWVGETERHLGEIFDAGEGGRIILLFDEADSLFGKRTEVRTANDRFANIEVNYLLQRLDSFEGIAILTTNFGKSIDPAFRRRLSVRLSFPFPDEELRARIWRAHIPAEIPTEADLGIDELARKYPLSGGYIRNIALRAAFLAAHEARPLGATHLERAIALEYRSMGKLFAGGALE